PADPAWHDAVVMGQIGFDIDRNPVKTDPSAQFDADCGDLVFARRAIRQRRPFGARHPDPDPALPDFSGNAEFCQRPDDPGFEIRDKASDVTTPAIEIKHHIGDALPRSVIGILPAAPRLKHRKARLQQILGPGTGSGGIKRRMLDQPDGFIRRASGYGGDPAFHEAFGFRVAGQAAAVYPFNHIRDLTRSRPAVKPLWHWRTPRQFRGHSCKIPLFIPQWLGYDPRHCPDAVVAELVDAQR